jgi:hypothetical protein
MGFASISLPCPYSLAVIAVLMGIALIDGSKERVVVHPDRDLARAPTFRPSSQRPSAPVGVLMGFAPCGASPPLQPRALVPAGEVSPMGGASPGERVAACSRLQSSPFFVLTVRARASAHWAGDFELGGSGLQPPHRVWHRAVSGASHRLQGGSMV